MTHAGAFRPPRILWITDPSLGEDVLVRVIAEVGAAVSRGRFGVQLRDKSGPRVALRAAALRLRAATRAVGASFFVNGSPEVARDVGADGVHLPADGRHRFGAGQGIQEARRVIGRATWVSIAAHTDEDVARARSQGADAVLVSPIFTTRPSGTGGPGAQKLGRGTDALRRARVLADAGAADDTLWRGASSARTPMFVFGLGGVTPATAAACLDAGADGIAMVRGLVGPGEPSRIARALHDAFARR